MADPINWKPENLPPGAMPWARQVEDAIDASNRVAARADENGSNTDASVASTMSSLSQQIATIEAQQATITAQQATLTTQQTAITNAQNYTTQLSQVYTVGSTATQSGLASGTWSNQASLRVSVTVPILTGKVMIQISANVQQASATFSCAAAGLTQSTANSVGSGNSLYNGLYNGGTTPTIGGTRVIYSQGLTTGINATFTMEFWSFGSSYLVQYPSIAVQNVGIT